MAIHATVVRDLGSPRFARDDETGMFVIFASLSTPTQKYRNMKARLRTHAVVANPRHSLSYVCGLRLALGVNPSLSFCSDTSASKY